MPLRNLLASPPFRRANERRFIGTRLSLTLFIALWGAPLAAEDGWKVYWKNGTHVESEDGELELTFGARIQVDFSSASGDDAIEQRFDLEGGSELRRARLFFEGTVYERFEFRAQYDFAGGDVEAKDVYVGIKDLPYVGGIRIGHLKEPFGLEQLTSSKYIVFLERSFTDDALSEGRNMGFLLHNQLHDDRVTWAVGAFRPSDGFGTSEDDVWNLTARVTGLPIYEDEGRRLFHLGLGVSQRSAPNDEFRIRTRPEAHLAPRFVDTGSFPADDASLVTLELATVRGPFWATSEITQADAAVPRGDGLDFSAFKVQAGYYLTGESRRFKTSTATWDRQKPNRNFVKGGGIGAWELALRYSQLDVTDQAITGGELDGMTFAVNWYPNPAVRAMLNFVRSELQGVGDADFLLVRVQIDF